MHPMMFIFFVFLGAKCLDRVSDCGLNEFHTFLRFLHNEVAVCSDVFIFIFHGHETLIYIR